MMKEEDFIKNMDLCDKCGFPYAKVIYGLVRDNDEIQDKIDRNLVVLGGCLEPQIKEIKRCKKCNYTILSSGETHYFKLK